MEKEIVVQQEEKKIRHDFSEVKNDMYELTKKGSVLGYLIVAASVIVFVFTGRGEVAVQVSMCVLILGVLQHLWQGFTLEIFLRYLERNDLKEFNTFPDYIGNGAWVIYAFKMIVAIMAAVELILSV